jgi:CheY-like chemotaxis protein
MKAKSGYTRFCTQRALLVGTPYDLYLLSESGFCLTQVAFHDDGLCDDVVLDLASNQQEALEKISNGNYQLVVTDHIAGKLDGYAVGRAVHQARPGLPVFLLTSDNRHGGPPEENGMRQDVDRVFIWSGNLYLARSMVYLLEDQINAEDDVLNRGMRWILLVEDEPNFYSHYIPMIYRELERQIGRLVTGTPKLTTSRCLSIRPRLLVAGSLGEAAGLLQLYHERLLGVISDLCFPVGSQLDPDAGFRLVELVRTLPHDLPVILQSMELDAEPKARQFGVNFVPKNSPELLSTLRQHLLDSFGFGDFIFKLPDGREVHRASTIEELREGIATAPLASVVHHARRHHFSNWLAIHGMFDLAERIRPIDGPDDQLRKLALEHISGEGSD